jgi:hypothetical protein
MELRNVWCRASILASFAVLSLVALPAGAGSTQPNPTARKAAIEQVRTDLQKVAEQWNWLGTKLSDKSAAASYNAAYGTTDKLNETIKTWGGSMTVSEKEAGGARATATPQASHVVRQACVGHACTTLPKSADDWHTRDKEHQTALKQLNSFFQALSTNEVLAGQFEGLLLKNDRKGLMAFFTKNGLTGEQVKISEMASDVKISFGFDWWHFSIEW